MLLNKITDFSQYTQLKVAMLSDTHEEVDNRILEVVSECDIAIHAGDIGCYAVLQQLKPGKQHVIAVAGNNDKPYLWDFSHWNIVKNLPQSVRLELPGGILAVEHGHVHDMCKPSHNDLRGAHPDARLILYGHTHKMVEDVDQPRQWVVNPGAAGYTRNKGGPSCMVLNIEQKNWFLKSYKFKEQSVA